MQAGANSMWYTVSMEPKHSFMRPPTTLHSSASQTKCCCVLVYILLLLCLHVVLVENHLPNITPSRNSIGCNIYCLIMASSPSLSNHKQQQTSEDEAQPLLLSQENMQQQHRPPSPEVMAQYQQAYAAWAAQYAAAAAAAGSSSSSMGGGGDLNNPYSDAALQQQQQQQQQQYYAAFGGYPPIMMQQQQQQPTMQWGMQPPQQQVYGGGGGGAVAYPPQAVAASRPPRAARRSPNHSPLNASKKSYDPPSSSIPPLQDIFSNDQTLLAAATSTSANGSSQNYGATTTSSNNNNNNNTASPQIWTGVQQQQQQQQQPVFVRTNSNGSLNKMNKQNRQHRRVASDTPFNKHHPFHRRTGSDRDLPPMHRRMVSGGGGSGSAGLRGRTYSDSHMKQSRMLKPTHRRADSTGSMYSFTSTHSRGSVVSNIAKSAMFGGVDDGGRVQLHFPFEAVRLHMMDVESQTSSYQLNQVYYEGTFADYDQFEEYHRISEQIAEGMTPQWESLDGPHLPQQCCGCACGNCTGCLGKKQLLPHPKYLLAVQDDIYKRVVGEIADAQRMPCGLFFCGHHEDVDNPSIVLAVIVVAALFLTMAYIAAFIVDG